MSEEERDEFTRTVLAALSEAVTEAVREAVRAEALALAFPGLGLLTAEEVGALLKVNPRTVKAWEAAGDLPSVNVAKDSGPRERGHVRFHPDAVRAFVRARSGTGTVGDRGRRRR